MKKVKNLVRKFIHFLGYDIQKIRKTPEMSSPSSIGGLLKVQYACGPNVLSDWVNVDFYHPEFMKNKFGMTSEYIYCQVDLSQNQPFPDNSFSLAFAEDFIEHLSQGDSIIFLSECFRVLKKGGVLRLSFPGLKGVLQRHFPLSVYTEIIKGKKDAYKLYDHIHFYSKEELELVATHLGFSGIQFAEFGCSDHDGLRGLETREKQQNLNLYVELTK